MSATISVGFAVRNGMPGVQQVLQHIERQTRPPLELLVSDNESTDGTAEVLAAHRSRLARYDVQTQTRNIGAVANFDAVLYAAAGDLFCWVAHDHDYPAEFVQELAGAIERAPEAVGATPTTYDVDALTGDVTRIDPDPDLAHPDVAVRVRAAMRRGAIFGIYGMYRRSALIAMGGVPDAFGADHLLVLGAILQGPLVAADTSFRYHRLPPRLKPQSDTLIERRVLAFVRRAWLEICKHPHDARTRVRCGWELARGLASDHWRGVLHRELAGNVRAAARQRRPAAAVGWLLAAGALRPAASRDLVAPTARVVVRGLRRR